MFKRVLLAFSLWLFPLVALAAADLGINASGFWLSVPFDGIEVSKTVRMYSRVENTTAEDAIAEIQFYVNDVLLGKRSITVLANSNGVAFWDWQTPAQEGKATLTARVFNQEGGDPNPDNDTVTIYDLFVNADGDADGVYNRLDNCPTLANAGQEDADEDGVGDACEPPPPAPTPAPAPTSPAPAAPTQPAPISEPETVEPVATETTPAEEAPVPSEQPVPAPTEDVLQFNENADQESAERLADDSQIIDLPVAGAAQELIIQAEQISWNMFRFRPSSRLGAGMQQYEWDFGDGETSQERVVEHAFAKPGRYSVNVRIFDENGASQTASMIVRVGFFNLANWRLWLIIALLAAIIIVAAVTVGMSETIVGETEETPLAKPLLPQEAASTEVKQDDLSFEPLTDESGDLDALASTGKDVAALGGDLALLESLGNGTQDEVKPAEAAAVEEAQVAKPKRKPAKKKPGKKRTIKVKNVS